VTHRWVACLLLALLAACGQDPGAPPAGRAGTYDVDGRWTGPPPALGRRPNIVLLVIDTLRADAVRPEQESGGDMPFLSGLAREHTSFREASSPSSWTVPALASMLTGTLQSNHGIRDEEVVLGNPGHLLSLAEVLRSTAGYQTAAFFGGLWPRLISALSQGFEETHDKFQLQRVEDILGPWAKGRRRQDPFFLLLHTYEAHDPYGAANHPPHEKVEVRDEDIQGLLALGEKPSPAELVRRCLLSAPQRRALRTHPALRAHNEAVTKYCWQGLKEDPNPTLAADLENAYRTGVRWVDGLLKRTFDELRRQGLLENTLWIVTSDHGEAFGEHGMLTHGRQLYDELVRIPLVMGGPAPFDRPLESQASVSLTDLLPTVLELVGLPEPSHVDGRSFLPGLREGAPGYPACAEVARAGQQTANLSVAEVVSVRDGAWKYIGTLDRLSGTLSEEAYDLRSDPAELRNLAGPDGYVRDLPFDEAFCKAVERMRDRLWGHAMQVDWNARQGYGTGALSVRGERPASDCAEPTR
jgi:arylsulfatase A-like enzyme